MADNSIVNNSNWNTPSRNNKISRGEWSSPLNEDSKLTDITPSNMKSYYKSPERSIMSVKTLKYQKDSSKTPVYGLKQRSYHSLNPRSDHNTSTQVLDQKIPKPFVIKSAKKLIPVNIPLIEKVLKPSRFLTKFSSSKR